MISFESLQAAGMGPTQARVFLAPLEQIFDAREINTPQRQAAFYAQASVESANFTQMEESGYYRDPARVLRIFPREVHTLLQAQGLVGNPRGLFNTVYANKNGNGNYLSGDGWNYRGRGFGLTGRANYFGAQQALGEPYIERPELAGEPQDACLIFGWFWATKGPCNELADKGDVDSITRIINGAGMQGAQDRRDAYAKALKAFR